MKRIELTKGYFATVDEEDYPALSVYKWHYTESAKNKGYAKRRDYPKGKKGKGFGIYMHRAIMNPSKGKAVDHINGNTLDNRKANLRICAHRENLRNRGKQCNNTSGYKGVSWHKQMKKWTARIMANNKYMSLGLFCRKEDAAEAYKKASKKYHGEFSQ